MATPSYTHDVWGATLRGYARRTREAVQTALKNAAGWTSPARPYEAACKNRFDLTLSVLIEEAMRDGISNEEIVKILERSTTQHSLSESRRAAARERQVLTEDPLEGKDPERVEAELQGLSKDQLISNLRLEITAREGYQAELERLR